MEWWQTLLVAVVTPAVTAVALLRQTRVNNDREDRRRAEEAAEREREREVHAAREAGARKHAIRDHWREERKEAHAALLADLASASDELSRQIAYAPTDDSASGLSNEAIEQMREHLAAVQMLSLPSTRQRAEEAFEALKESDGTVFALRVLLGDVWTDDDKGRRDKAKNALRDLTSARRSYLGAVRIELGTEEGDF